MDRSGPLRCTQAADLITTHPLCRPGNGNNSPTNSAKGGFKPLFGRINSYQDVTELTRANDINISSPGMIRQKSSQFLVPNQRDSVRSISYSLAPLPRSLGSSLVQPDLRNSTAAFNIQPQNQPMNQYSSLRGSYDPYRDTHQPQSQQLNRSAGNFNIFEHFQHQAQQQPSNSMGQIRSSPLSVLYGADPHQALLMSSSQAYPGSIQGGNIFAHYAAKQDQKPQQMDAYARSGSQGRSLSPGTHQSSGLKTPFDLVNEHTQVRENNGGIAQGGLNMPHDNEGGFHGKSMRSIQLFNSPTSANPRMLHPSMNPMVKADSPKSSAKKYANVRGRPSMLDIHADSCYNFLNKRRYRVSPQDQTPLECFFLKESVNQYKVTSELQRNQRSVYPSNKPGPLRRTKRYLLVLDIDETLVHSEPIVTGGRQTAAANKLFDNTLRFPNPNGSCDIYGVTYRPFMHDFIHRMSQLYDLAVYTASSRDYADAIMDTIDPNRCIFCARLCRENCLPVAGMNIKNMSNFDGKDVFIVDNLIYSYAFHMDQGIPICAFVDDPIDVELQDLAEILENLPFYESLQSLLQDLLGLEEFYQDLSNRLRSPHTIQHLAMHVTIVHLVSASI